jgi:hypothetical protein
LNGIPNFRPCRTPAAKKRLGASACAATFAVGFAAAPVAAQAPAPSHDFDVNIEARRSQIKRTIIVPLIGGPKVGRNSLYASDTFDDCSILVRGSWSDITPNAHRCEESNSDGGGRTWHPAFISQLIRMSR